MNTEAPRPGTEPTYSAVILYFRRGPEVRRTIESLTRQTVPPREIVIVDNASGDGVVTQVVESFGRRIRLVTSERNLGYSGGMRLGAEQLDGRSSWVLFLTHEVILAEDCCEELLRAQALNPTAAQLGPTTFLLDSHDRVWSAGGLLTRRGTTSHRTILPADDSIEPGSALPADWLDGCCHLIRADLIAPELWDERYFLYWEDVDISTVLRRSGKVVCVPQAVAWQGTGLMPIYFATRNRIVYWRKWRSARFLATSVIEPLAKVLLRDLLSRHPDSAAARARLNGVRDGLTGRLHPVYGDRSRRTGPDDPSVCPERTSEG